MPRQISFTDDALSDLASTARWLTQPGAGSAARRRLTAIWTAIERLRLYPCLYSVGPNPGIRELTCEGGYRVLYDIEPDTGRNETAGDVRVLRVFGPGQARGVALPRGPQAG